MGNYRNDKYIRNFNVTVLSIPIVYDLLNSVSNNSRVTFLSELPYFNSTIYDFNGLLNFDIPLIKIIILNLSLHPIHNHFYITHITLYLTLLNQHPFQSVLGSNYHLHKLVRYIHQVFRLSSPYID